MACGGPGCRGVRAGRCARARLADEGSLTTGNPPSMPHALSIRRRGRWRATHEQWLRHVTAVVDIRVTCHLRHASTLMSPLTRSAASGRFSWYDASPVDSEGTVWRHLAGSSESFPVRVRGLGVECGPLGSDTSARSSWRRGPQHPTDQRTLPPAAPAPAPAGSLSASEQPSSYPPPRSQPSTVPRAYAPRIDRNNSDEDRVRGPTVLFTVGESPRSSRRVRMDATVVANLSNTVRIGQLVTRPEVPLYRYGARVSAVS